MIFIRELLRSSVQSILLFDILFQEDSDDDSDGDDSDSSEEESSPAKPAPQTNGKEKKKVKFSINKTCDHIPWHLY